MSGLDADAILAAALGGEIPAKNTGRDVDPPTPETPPEATPGANPEETVAGQDDEPSTGQTVGAATADQLEAAARVGLPAEMAERLRGSTWPEIRADAESFAQALGAQKVGRLVLPLGHNPDTPGLDPRTAQAMREAEAKAKAADIEDPQQARAVEAVALAEDAIRNQAKVEALGLAPHQLGRDE